MSTTELKASLHEMIEREANEHLLKQVQDMLTNYYHTPIDELGGQTIHEFNVEMEESEAEMDAGKFYTHEEVVAKLDELFRK